jgi:hypothetical protein
MRRIHCLLMALLLFACSKPPTADRPVRGPASEQPPKVSRETAFSPSPESLSGEITADIPDSADLTAAPVVIAQVRILDPAPDEIVANPVSFKAAVAGPIVTVAWFGDALPLQEQPLLAGQSDIIHRFKGTNVIRRIRLEGYGADGQLLAFDEHLFVPADGYLPQPPGFNRFIIDVLNDPLLFPRDSRYPYCWRECPGSMGMVRDVYYLDQEIWPGDGHCFCTGHTLEILAAAIHRWQSFHGIDSLEPFGDLTIDSLRGGVFYQFWQGYGVTEEASSAAALEAVGIGYALLPEEWESAMPGDFVNLSRENGTGHAVLFHSWIKENGRIVGLRYYGCNRRGDTHPNPENPNNSRVSGPSFVSARLSGEGGAIIPRYLFIGHVIDPILGY